MKGRERHDAPRTALLIKSGLRRAFQLVKESARKPWCQAVKTLDCAAPPNSRMDFVPPGAQLPFSGRHVETVVEIQRGAVLGQLGAKPRAVEQQEIDRFAARKGGCRGCSTLRCTWAPFLLPCEGLHRPRPDGDAHDHLALDHERPHLVRLAQPKRSRTSPERAREEAKTAFMRSCPRYCMLWGHRVEQSMNCPGHA